MPPLFIVDSFTKVPFKGNPAGVVLLEHSYKEPRMQSIATELNFSETAFATANSERNTWDIRYFSPVKEIPLCGHATLATSKVLFQQTDCSSIHFLTHSGVSLTTKQVADRIEMSFPTYSLTDTTAPPALLAALGIETVNYAGFNTETNILMLEIESSEQLASLTPDFLALKESHDSIDGVSVTAAGHNKFDFHSRYFWPWSGGEEDPVTGGTHTFLAPYWAEKLGKKVMQSFQASKRSGQMEVEIDRENELLIRGDAVMILEGELKI
jgi:PhzF family phenazine biosynthesis protein